MWILYATGSAFFAGITSILAKCGIKKTDSDVATAIRTIVVLLFSWLMVLVAGSGSGIGEIDGKTMLFLVLSGIATGASWLCYFRALQVGDVNKVVTIDKSSTVLTILLALIFLREGLSIGKAVAVILIGAGTMLMITKKEGETNQQGEKKEWMLYAILSAVFASLTAILGKIGIEGVDSNLGTAIRTTVVLVMAWMMVGITGKHHQVKELKKKELILLCYRVLQQEHRGFAIIEPCRRDWQSVVVPIDKLSILVTILFSWIVFMKNYQRKRHGDWSVLWQVLFCL